MALRTVNVTKEALRFIEFLTRALQSTPLDSPQGTLQAGDRLLLVADDGEETEARLPRREPEDGDRRRTAAKAGLIQRH